SIGLPANTNRWTREEDHALLTSIQKHGGKWSIISRDIGTGRKPIHCCRRWNAIVRCSLRRVALN
ncbi:5941_t:CDS:1, partial [Cetraspora pellucida]